ncbi:hypothetical protein COT77_01335 [Candidatus Berkelbacteria bacterium CG10_big_fil_rev_8_21_14_0_10_41_12]|uniref:Dihydroorotate dehydrogenase catalytic domain-containing protein n=1 Tax=Candidatus Berkelbacteria bacterium CG10_big_fil_rev_8_21_14_0_10_41_12 TaxID=1974513 RepID=A0A2M6WXD0_9BACT|nr:MAG: hypothetical protein COT77_01335 [Candidatus Berkelbacteria bacterium CG10_big_fil_rev_8_21_14_0_10_41_12]
MRKRPFIQLPNGHIIDIMVDSVLGTDGQGYFLARLLYALFGWARYTERPLVAKTITLEPRRGNFRWYFPFSAVLIWFAWGHGFFKLNRWGWTNEGLDRWVKERWPTLRESTRSPIVSIGPLNVSEAVAMVERLNELNLAAIVVSVGCLNVGARSKDEAVEIVLEVLKRARHPVIVKFTAEQDYIGIATQIEKVIKETEELEGKTVVFQITNTIHWSNVFPKRRMPFGQDWAVSGPPIRSFGLEAVRKLREAGVKSPIIGGGGITHFEHVKDYLEAGADAVYVSTGYRESRVREWAIRL